MPRKDLEDEELWELRRQQEGLVSAGLAAELELLLQLPVDPSQIALLIAADCGEARCVSLLLEAEANPDAVEEANPEPRGCFLVFPSPSALWLASRHGHVDVVQLLLRAGADPDAAAFNFVDREDEFDSLLIADRARTHQSALWIASWRGHLQVVKLLLQAGADRDQCNYDGVSPLHVAAHKTDLDLTYILLRFAADVNCLTLGYQTPLFKACRQGCAEVARVLLQAGADVDKAAMGLYWDETGDDIGMPCGETTPLWIAAFMGHSEVLAVLLQSKAAPDCPNGQQKTPLWSASAGGHVHAVRLLLKAGAAVDQGPTPLSAATYQGHAEIVSLLLAARADVDRRCGCDHLQFPQSRSILSGPVEDLSPLWIAVLQQRWKLVQLLLTARADAAKPGSYGGCVLGLAARGRPMNWARALLDAGAQRELSDTSGEVPRLLIAARSGCAISVSLLLDDGAQMELGNPHLPWAAFWAALSSGRVEVVRLLLAAKLDADVIDEEGIWFLEDACCTSEGDQIQVTALCLHRGI